MIRITADAASCVVLLGEDAVKPIWSVVPLSESVRNMALDHDEAGSGRFLVADVLPSLLKDSSVTFAPDAVAPALSNESLYTLDLKKSPLGEILFQILMVADAHGRVSIEPVLGSNDLWRWPNSSILIATPGVVRIARMPGDRRADLVKLTNQVLRNLTDIQIGPGSTALPIDADDGTVRKQWAGFAEQSQSRLTVSVRGDLGLVVLDGEEKEIEQFREYANTVLSGHYLK